MQIHTRPLKVDWKDVSQGAAVSFGPLIGTNSNEIMLYLFRFYGQKWDSGDATSLRGEADFYNGSKVHFISKQTRIFAFCLEMHFQFELNFDPII